MNALELTTFITMLGNWIACNVEDDDVLALLAAEITQLGDTLATIAAKRVLCDKIEEKRDSSLNINST